MNINKNDFVIGIAASGTTPYVLGAIEKCNSKKIPTGCITCNPGSPLSELSKFPIVVNVGPEVVTGSSRNESRYSSKNGFKYDFYNFNDNDWKSRG